jgi:AraC-like DNA-binding protein
MANLSLQDLGNGAAGAARHSILPSCRYFRLRKRTTRTNWRYARKHTDRSRQPAMLACMDPLPSLQPWRLKLACRYIDDHLSGPVPLADLSREVGFTDMHFARLFRASTGISPHNYVLRRRIEVAQAALLNVDRSLLDVALMVGFRTQAHFSAVFKKITGLPPRRWRQLMMIGSSNNNQELK